MSFSIPPATDQLSEDRPHFHGFHKQNSGQRMIIVFGFKTFL